MLLFQSLRMLITLACPNNWCALVHAPGDAPGISSKLLLVALLEAAKSGEELQML